MTLPTPQIKDLSLKQYLEHELNDAAYKTYHTILKPEFRIEILDFKEFLTETYTLLAIIYFNYEITPYEVSEYFLNLNKSRQKENNPILHAFQYDLIWGTLLVMTSEVKTLETGEKKVDDNQFIYQGNYFMFLFDFVKQASERATEIKGKTTDFVDDIADRYHRFYDNKKYMYDYAGAKELLNYFHSLFLPGKKDIENIKPAKDNEKKDIPFKIALLNEIGFFDLPKIKNLPKTKQRQIIARIIGGTDRFIEGNISVLNCNSKEDPLRFTAIGKMDEVKQFLSTLNNK